MNTTSASRGESSQVEDVAEQNRGILVWDAPVRVFHWLMVICFAGAYLTGESESLRLVHVTLGYTMAGLVGFRIVWGLVGSRYARFSNFVRGPAATVRYLRSLASSRPEHHIGHNPAGALAILALLGGTVVLVATGWANYNDIGGKVMEELHEGIASAMLALVIVHILAVLLSSWLHRENLVKAMLTGRKEGAASAGISKPSRIWAALLLVGVLVFWALQWQSARPPATGGPAAGMQHERH